MMGVDSGGVEFAYAWTRANVNHLVLFRGGLGRLVLV